MRISGVPVGKVKTVKLARNGLNIATLQLDAKYAPIPADSRAILRQKTLLGETYVELTPGNEHDATSSPRAARWRPRRCRPTVELDEIFRPFNDETRQDFQVWMQSLAVGVPAAGRTSPTRFGNLAPFADDTTTC